MRKLLLIFISTFGIGGAGFSQENQDATPPSTASSQSGVYNEADDDLGIGGGDWKLSLMDKFGVTASKEGIGAEASLSLVLLSLDVLGLRETGGQLKEQPFPVLGLGYTLGLPKFGSVARYQEFTLDFLLLGLGFGRHFDGSKDIGRQVTINFYLPYLYPKYPVSIFARSKFEDGEKTEQVFGLAIRMSISAMIFD